MRGAGELAGAQRARGEPSLSVWSAKHAIARSAKGLRQQTRSHVQARPPLSQYNLPHDGYAANHLRPPQEPVETDGLCDDPGAVSKVAIRDTEPKLHRNHRLVPSRESASEISSFTSKPRDHHSTRECPSHVSGPEFDRISRTT